MWDGAAACSLPAAVQVLVDCGMGMGMGGGGVVAGTALH